jgi:hypothetical protein
MSKEIDNIIGLGMYIDYVVKCYNEGVCPCCQQLINRDTRPDVYVNSIKAEVKKRRLT